MPGAGWGWVYLFKAPSNEILTARRMWAAGFVGLPLIWLLNWLNFREAAAAPGAPSELRSLVSWSGRGAALAGAAAACWFVMFQYRVDDWVCPCDGPFGSDMSCR